MDLERRTTVRFEAPDAMTYTSTSTGAADLRDLRIHEAISARAAATPAACAVVFEDVSYSYAWLEERSDSLAAGLAAAGVVQGQVVAVHLERSADMVAALVGCLKAGAAYMPLDPAFPVSRLEAIVEDAGPAALITEAGLDGVLAGAAALPRVRVDAPGAPGPVTAPAAVVGPDDLAYVLYTSGSTGRPKGVEIRHGAVMNLMASFRETPGFTAADRMLAAATTAFDMSVVELFLPLVTGGRMVLASRATAADPQRLAALIADGDCTFAQATPSLWRYLLDGGWGGKADLTVVSGGEALTRDLADRLLACSGSVWNAYGPTETTVWSAIGAVGPGADPVPVGGPLAETTLYVFDDAGAPVADGGLGELHIGGTGLARGYRGRPDLTRERFIERDGERLYRTGDLARRLPDGAWVCAGRTDHQVKIRGFRIELGDVEAALLACAGVGAATVNARVRGDGMSELVAHLTGRGGEAPPDAAVLRHALAERLPAYMIPSRFVALDALPLTPNGKVDRAVLPAPPETSEAASEDLPSDARTDTERRLGAIWSQVLGLSSLLRTDDFFELGGYSLLTLSLLRRIRETFGRTLGMADLFTAPDLAGMAALIDAPERVASGPIPLQPLGARPALIWFDAGPQMRPLAARLAPDQPMLGLNLDPEEEEALSRTPLDVRGPAERLVARLRAFQPRGPYYLGGWCRWGAVTHAAACQLRSQGETVGLLVMLDTINHASARQTFLRLKESARDRMRPRARVAERDQPFGERVEAAARRYRPAPYDGDVLLLRAADTDRDWDGASGWADSARGRFVVADLAGTHRSVLAAPQVDALADRLKAALAEAQARCG